MSKDKKISITLGEGYLFVEEHYADETNVRTVGLSSDSGRYVPLRAMPEFYSHGKILPKVKLILEVDEKEWKRAYKENKK